MQHPLEFIPPHRRKLVFYFLFLFTLGLFGILRGLDLPLQTSPAPDGMVSFELAYPLEQSQAILASWNETARLTAAFGLGLDFVFILAYTSTLSLALLLTNGDSTNWVRPLTSWMGWAVFLAGVWDVIENLALWQILTGNIDPGLPKIAAICAILKFSLLTAGLFSTLVRKAGRHQVKNTPRRK